MLASWRTAEVGWKTPASEDPTKNSPRSQAPTDSRSRAEERGAHVQRHQSRSGSQIGNVRICSGDVTTSSSSVAGVHSTRFTTSPAYPGARCR